MDVDPWSYVLALALGLGIGFGGSFIYGFVNRLRKPRKEPPRWKKPGDR